MRQALWCLRALLSHWRRSPFQLFALLLGLTVATALWSGVQAINSQAGQSYDKAANLLGGNDIPVIGSLSGQDFSDKAFGRLRRAGWNVSPILEGEILVGGNHYRMIGIEPLSYPANTTALPLAKEQSELITFIHPGRTLLNPATFNQIKISGADWATDEGIKLPPAVMAENIPPGVMIVDMAIAQTVLDKRGLISKLLLSPAASDAVPDPIRLAGTGLQISAPSETVSLGQLTDSFHLNLTAFGFLSFFVGLFIVHSAIGLAFEQRRAMIRTLRACGVSARQLSVVLISELLLFALVAGSAGVAAGYMIAAALLPDVAASLRGLYGAEISGELSLHFSWWLLGLLMSVLGALIAAAGSLYKSYRLPLLAPAAPNAWRTQQLYWLKYQAFLAFILFVLAVLFLVFPGGLIGSFMMMGSLLLGAALLLPFILSLMLNIGQMLAKKPVAQWFWADGQQQLSGLSMALMALFLALSVNIGVGTMVESFRLTFLGWLDTRLVSEIYVRGLDEENTERLRQWSVSDARIMALLPIWKTDQTVAGWPTEIYGFKDHETYRDKWQLLEATDNHWEDVANGKAVLISEQMARKIDVSLKGLVSIPTRKGLKKLPVAGIFPDYGNPRGMIMVNIIFFTRHWPEAPRNRFGIRTTEKYIPDLIEEIRDRFNITDDKVIDQASLKSYSISVFEKTFAITVALNSLTLLVAGIAILTGLLSLSQIRLPQLAPLWAMGITRKSLAGLELLKSLSLAAFTALFAIPFGILLAWCLVAIINVEAFGWRLPLYLFPSQWLNLFLLALLTALLSSLFPVYRLYRIKADKLLKVFADER